MRALAFTLLFLAVPALAQNDAPAAGYQERVDVHLVQIELLATTKNGEPVTDLRAEDLLVKEDGKPQTIALFQSHAPAAPPSTPVPDARILFAAPDGLRPLASAGREPRWLVFFFDLVHGDVRTRKLARDAARDFVAHRLEPGDRVAVASFDGTAHLDQGFIADPEGLDRAIDAAFERPATPLDEGLRMRELLTVIRSCQKQMIFNNQQYRPGQECLAGAGRVYVEEVQRLSAGLIAGVDTLTRLLAGVQGRKVLLLFSHGVSLDPGWEAVEAVEAVAGNNQDIRELRYELTHGREVDDRRDFAAAIERAVRSGVTVFGIDGTPTPTGDFGIEERVRLRGTARPYTVAWEQARASLEELSIGTGGKFFGKGDFGVDLERAFDALRGGYTVGYYRDGGGGDGGDGGDADFHKIKVTSKRRGVEISTRKGYYLEPAARAAHLGRLDLGTRAPRDGADGVLVPFSVTVNPLAFELLAAGDAVGTSFTLHLLLRTAGGRPIADSFHFLSHSFPRATYEEGKVVAPRYDGSLVLPPGAYVFSAVLRDPRQDTYAELSETISVP